MFPGIELIKSARSETQFRAVAPVMGMILHSDSEGTRCQSK